MQIKWCPPPTESPHHKFMVVLNDYTVPRLTFSGYQCDDYKLLCKLRQVVIGHALQTYISDVETIRGITWLIIGDGCQYFRQYFMPSAFTGNRIEGQIAFPTSTLGLLVNQLIMVIPIIVKGILAK